MISNDKLYKGESFRQTIITNVLNLVEKFYDILDTYCIKNVQFNDENYIKNSYKTLLQSSCFLNESFEPTAVITKLQTMLLKLSLDFINRLKNSSDKKLAKNHFTNSIEDLKSIKVILFIIEKIEKKIPGNNKILI